MSYEKINWVDNQTPLSAANLNHMETGIAGAYTAINSINTWQNQLVFTDAIEQAAVTAILRATGGDSSKKVFLMVKSPGLIYNVSAQEVLDSLSGQGSLTPVWGGELAATLEAAKAYVDDLIGGIENGSY